MWARLLILTLDRNHAESLHKLWTFWGNWRCRHSGRAHFWPSNHPHSKLVKLLLSPICSALLSHLNAEWKLWTLEANISRLFQIGIILLHFGGSSELPDVYIRSKSESKIWKWASVLSRWTEIVPRCSVTIQRVYGQLSGLGFLSAWLLVESESGK